MLKQSDKKETTDKLYKKTLWLSHSRQKRNDTNESILLRFILTRRTKKKAWEKIIAKTLAVTFDRHKNKTYFYLPTFLRETPKKHPQSGVPVRESDRRTDGWMGVKPLKSKRRSNRSLRSLIKSCKCKCFVPILSVFCFDKTTTL